MTAQMTHWERVRAAIRGEDPVIYCEHKGLYRQAFAARPEPANDYLLPLGYAEVVQQGDDITLITWGLQVQRSIEAVKSLGELNPSVEIIDIRLRKAESFELYAQKFEAFKDYFESGRFMEELLREFENNCQKLFLE